MACAQARRDAQGLAAMALRLKCERQAHEQREREPVERDRQAPAVRPQCVSALEVLCVRNWGLLGEQHERQRQERERQERERVEREERQERQELERQEREQHERERVERNKRVERDKRERKRKREELAERQELERRERVERERRSWEDRLKTAKHARTANEAWGAGGGGGPPKRRRRASSCPPAVDPGRGPSSTARERTSRPAAPVDTPRQAYIRELRRLLGGETAMDYDAALELMLDPANAGNCADSWVKINPGVEDFNNTDLYSRVTKRTVKVESCPERKIGYNSPFTVLHASHPGRRRGCGE